MDSSNSKSNLNLQPWIWIFFYGAMDHFFKSIFYCYKVTNIWWLMCENVQSGPPSASWQCERKKRDDVGEKQTVKTGGNVCTTSLQLELPGTGDSKRPSGAKKEVCFSSICSGSEFKELTLVCTCNDNLRRFGVSTTRKEHEPKHINLLIHASSRYRIILYYHIIC